MGELANYRKLIGNVCLHQGIAATVHKRFLRRNLTQVLDSHDRSLHRTSDDSTYEDMIANERRISGWDYPTKEMLNDMLKGQKPILQIRSLQIRHPRSKAGAAQKSGDRSNGPDGLDWLQDPDADFTTPCQVGISVTESLAPTKRLYVDTRRAVITQKQGSELYPPFDVELDLPFQIAFEKLFVVTDSGTNGHRHWKRTTTAKYTMEITVQCMHWDHSADLLSRLEGKESSSYQDTPGNEGVLKAIWEHLPECPADSQLMPLRRAQKHKSLELDYKMQAALGWTDRVQNSPLERYNKALTRAHKPKHQLPTPSASEDLNKVAKHYVMTYNFRDDLVTRTSTVEGLSCPICPDSREHASFDRLQLHCLKYHDHFKFEETQDERSSTVVRKIVWISLGDEPDDSQKALDLDKDEWESWIAPNRPFNVSAIFRGDDSWADSGRTRGKGDRNYPSRTKAKGQRGRPAKDKEKELPQLQEIHSMRKRPAPDDVEDLPERKPKKHRVPDVPGVNFYRTTSKQLLNPGDYMAESDDDVDESWLEQRQSRSLGELGLAGASKDFAKAFNQHLAREQSDSTVLMKEALVRFTRAHQAELQDVEWQRLFRTKLNELRADGVIGNDIVAHCLRGLRTVSMEKTPEGEAVRAGAEREASEARSGTSKHENGVLTDGERKKWSGGKFVPRASQQPSKNKTGLSNGDTDSLKRDSANSMEGLVNGNVADHRQTNLARVCSCGKSAAGASGGIFCAGPRCIRKDYHMACVGLERRINGWKCPDCSS